MEKSSTSASSRWLNLSQTSMAAKVSKNLSLNKRNQMAKLLEDKKYKQRIIKSKKVYNRKDKNYAT